MKKIIGVRFKKLGKIYFFNPENLNIKKGDKVAILLMNCLEWLPIYFGILKAGAIAVPLNYRYTAEEIKYCLELAEADVLVFGPEFIGRVEEISDRIPGVKQTFYVGA